MQRNERCLHALGVCFACMRWGCREGFGRRLYGVGVLRVLGLGLRVYGVGFGVWAVPGRDGRREDKCGSTVFRKKAWSEGAREGRGKGGRELCVAVLCPRVFAKNTQRDAAA